METPLPNFQYTIRYIVDGVTKERVYYRNSKTAHRAVEREFIREMRKNGYGGLDKRPGSRWKIIAIACD